jgi:hypothetical protein
MFLFFNGNLNNVGFFLLLLFFKLYINLAIGRVEQQYSAFLLVTPRNQFFQVLFDIFTNNFYLFMFLRLPQYV